MIQSDALHNLLDATEERIRIWELYRLYGWMLTRNGYIKEIKEIDPNCYELTVIFREYETQMIDGKATDVVWWNTEKVILEPTND